MVRVPISIGSYHDHVDYNVVPMDACYLLLGRPWIYDIDALHHGRTNQYTFVFQDKKFVFEPMTSFEIRKLHAPQSEQIKQQGVNKNSNHVPNNLKSQATPSAK